MYYIFNINTIKSPKSFTTAYSSHYYNGRQQTCNNCRKQTFHFDLPKDAGINLKHEIYSTIKNQIKQLLSKYKLGNNIHEHGKQ